MVKCNKVTLASFGTFFGIFVLNENYLLENAFGKLVKKPGSRGIVIIKGEDIDSNIFTVGPHIHKWRGQLLAPSATSGLGEIVTESRDPHGLIPPAWPSFGPAPHPRCKALQALQHF